jgi:hypothetical protein
MVICRHILPINFVVLELYRTWSGAPSGGVTVFLLLGSHPVASLSDSGSVAPGGVTSFSPSLRNPKPLRPETSSYTRRIIRSFHTRLSRNKPRFHIEPSGISEVRFIAYEAMNDNLTRPCSDSESELPYC